MSAETKGRNEDAAAAVDHLITLSQGQQTILADLQALLKRESARIDDLSKQVTELAQRAQRASVPVPAGTLPTP